MDKLDLVRMLGNLPPGGLDLQGSLLDILRRLGQTDPEQAHTLMDALGFTGGPNQQPNQQPNPEAPGLYWDARHPSQGGTGRIETSVRAPSQDHYRLVDSLEEAQHIFDQGERPLMFGNLEQINPDAIDPAMLRKAQEDQWAAPNGIPLFTDHGINPEHPGTKMTLPSLDHERN